MCVLRGFPEPSAPTSPPDARISRGARTCAASPGRPWRVLRPDAKHHCNGWQITYRIIGFGLGADKVPQEGSPMSRRVSSMPMTPGPAVSALLDDHPCAGAWFRIVGRARRSGHRCRSSVTCSANSTSTRLRSIRGWRGARSRRCRQHQDGHARPDTTQDHTGLNEVRRSAALDHFRPNVPARAGSTEVKFRNSLRSANSYTHIDVCPFSTGRFERTASAFPATFPTLNPVRLQISSTPSHSGPTRTGRHLAGTRLDASQPKC